MKLSWISARLLGVALLLSVLTSCVLFNPTDPYGPVRARERRVGAGARGYVGSRSAASQPALPSPLTLDRCVALAQENNPDIGRADWNVAVADAERDIAAGQRWPTLHAVGRYNYSLNNQRFIQPRSATDPSIFGRHVFAGDLVLNMPIFTGGRITSEIQASELLQEVAEHRLTRTREELVFNVSSVFYQILAQRRVIDSLDFSVKTLEEHRRRVSDLIDVQKAARVDLLRTQVRLADLKQRRVRETNALAILKRVLVNLMGASGPIADVQVEGELHLTPTEPDLPSSVDRAFARRADYLAARAELEAQAKRVDAARAARWPTVNLQGSYGVRHAANPTSQPAGADSTEDVGFIGATAEIPLFEGGRINAQIRKERSALGAAQQYLRGLELQIHLDVETAILNIDAAGQRVNATEEAVAQARESLRIEREKYDLGRSSQTDVLDAQSALLDAETNYYRALADHNTARAELALAVGDD